MRILIVLLIASMGFGTITGCVVDVATREPLVGAVVQLWDGVTARRIWQGRTDPRGCYRAYVKAGNYALLTYYLGYTFEQRFAAVGPGRRSMLDVIGMTKGHKP